MSKKQSINANRNLIAEKRGYLGPSQREGKANRKNTLSKRGKDIMGRYGAALDLCVKIVVKL